MRVMDRITPDPSSVRPYHTPAATEELICAEGLRHVAVIEEGKLVGILSDRDLRKHQSAPPPGDSGRVVNSRSSEESAPNAAGEEDAG